MPRSMLLLGKFSPNQNFYAYPVKKISYDDVSLRDKLFYYFFLTEEYIKYLLSHIIIFVK